MIVIVKNYESLLGQLSTVGFTKLNAKHVNQNSLKNLHGLLCAVGCANTAPNNQQYEGSLKTLVINGTFGVRIKGTYCDSARNVEPYFCLEGMLRFKDVKPVYIPEAAPPPAVVVAEEMEVCCNDYALIGGLCMFINNLCCFSLPDRTRF